MFWTSIPVLGAEFGEGDATKHPSVKEKGVLSEKRGGIQWMRGLVRNSTGKTIQWRGPGHSVNSENWSCCPHPLPENQRPREASTLIFEIRSCAGRSDLKNKQKISWKCLIFKIRSYNARSDLKSKSARFSGSYLSVATKTQKSSESPGHPKPVMLKPVGRMSNFGGIWPPRVVTRHFPYRPPNPKKFKDTKKLLKSYFRAPGQSDSKVT